MQKWFWATEQQGEQTNTVSLWRRVRVLFISILPCSNIRRAVQCEFSKEMATKWREYLKTWTKPDIEIQRCYELVKVVSCRYSMKTKAVMYMSLKMNLFKIEDSYKNSHGCCAFSRRNCQREVPGIVVGSTPLWGVKHQVRCKNEQFKQLQLLKEWSRWYWKRFYFWIKATNKF